jgi:hypothetical protein
MSSLFDELTEKELKKTKRKGYRAVKLEKFFDKLRIPRKLADVFWSIYWR